MKIGIIDADLVGRNKHRFPNLASMKISGYYKKQGNHVDLLLNYDNLDAYDLIYISKVFTDTYIPEEVLNLSNVKYGGTGFFYDKAEPLPIEIEHHMPDYDLYLDWVNEQINNGRNRNEFEYYLDYSIGFVTRGCFRKCDFCVNKNYNKVHVHSPLREFYDKNKKYICLLDDNILGTHYCWDILDTLISFNKPFQFKQGMDLRIMTDKRAEKFKKVKYKGDFIFAFDNIADKEKIEEKLKIWRKYISKATKLYVFCAFDRDDKWDDEFWKQDIIDVFDRVIILMKYSCLPYIMRFNKYEVSPYRGMYINLARWCNQPNFFKKKSFREFCIANGTNSSTYKYMAGFEKKHPEIAEKYFDLKFEELKQLKY